MADENKDQSKPIASGMESSPTGQLRSDATQSTGTSSVTRSTSALTGGVPTGGDGMRTSQATATSGTTQTRQNLKESTAGMAQSARQYAGDMAVRAKEKGRTMFDQQKESALGQVSSVAGAIRSTARNLEGEGQGQTAHYIQLIADQLESLSGRLRDKDLDTLVRDAQNIARRSPGTFLVGSVVAGFLLARFLKSSSERQDYRSEWSEDDQRAIAAGEAGPYVGVGAATASPMGADGTPASSAGTTGNGASPAGLAGSNIGGNRL